MNCACGSCAILWNEGEIWVSGTRTAPGPILGGCRHYSGLLGEARHLPVSKTAPAGRPLFTLKPDITGTLKPCLVVLGCPVITDVWEPWFLQRSGFPSAARLNEWEIVAPLETAVSRRILGTGPSA